MSARCALLALCVSALAACQGQPKGDQAARVSSKGGIVNLLTMEKMEGGSTLAIHHGIFRRQGRCLVLEVDGARSTPVFSADAGVAVNGDGIRITGLDFAFGDTVGLPGLGPSYAGEPVGECPTARRLVRSVEAMVRARRDER